MVMVLLCFCLSVYIYISTNIICIYYQYISDVWATMDGGMTWGECSSGAGFVPRENPSTAMDPNGYLYVSGGTAMTGSTLQDLWVSPFSFNNLTAVSIYCGLTVPICGLGLQCYPTSDLTFTNCPSICPNRLASSSSSSGSSSASVPPPSSYNTTNGNYIELPIPPWTARTKTGIAFVTRSLNVSIPGTGLLQTPIGPTAVMYTGSAGNDVWISTNYMQTWSLISGTAGTTTATTTNLRNTDGCAVYDPYASIFYSFGSTQSYYSSDAINWYASALYNAPGGFSSMGCAVDQNSVLYLMGGSQTAAVGDYSNGTSSSPNLSLLYLYTYI